MVSIKLNVKASAISR